MPRLPVAAVISLINFLCRSYALKLTHTKELLSDRILWTGDVCASFCVHEPKFTVTTAADGATFGYLRAQDHPLLSVFLVDKLHPFSKIERFFHGIVTVLYRHILSLPLYNFLTSRLTLPVPSSVW